MAISFFSPVSGHRLGLLYIMVDIPWRYIPSATDKTAIS